MAVHLQSTRGTVQVKNVESLEFCFSKTGLHSLDVQENLMLFCYAGWIGIVIQIEQ